MNRTLHCFFIFFCLARCGNYDATRNSAIKSNQSASSPNYQTIRQAVFAPRCFACHSGPEPEAGLDLASYQSLKSHGVISPGHPSDSLLYEYIAEGRMPPDSPLPKKQIDLIRKWIEEGAKP